jgi:hypothetical protein
VQTRVGRLETASDASHEVLAQLLDRVEHMNSGLLGRLQHIEAVLKADNSDWTAAGFKARDAALIASVIDEVNRLDGYLVYYVSTLAETALAIRGDLMPLAHSIQALSGWSERAHAALGFDALAVTAVGMTTRRSRGEICC